MSDLARAFDHGKAFIAFLTCGDPDLETTAAAVRAAVQNGADLIELGIPFSDPTAEGPVIQAANLRALQSGTTTDKIFDLVRELRRDVTIPMVFMTYANVVFSYGTERFLSNCRDAGIDGLILPDVPYEEKEEFLPACHKYGVDFVSLIAPTSESRIADDRARGRTYGDVLTGLSFRCVGCCIGNVLNITDVSSIRIRIVRRFTVSTDTVSAAGYVFDLRISGIDTIFIDGDARIFNGNLVGRNAIFIDGRIAGGDRAICTKVDIFI